jgi:hypothetical protein
MKIRLVGAEFHTDGQTEGKTDGQPGTKPIVALRNFAKAPENYNFTHFVKTNIVGLFLWLLLLLLFLL